MTLTPFNFDALGNLETYFTENSELVYHYDASQTPGRSNLLSAVDLGASNPINYKTFTYDTRGNVTDNGLITFTYNLANQMVGAGDGKTFLYDGHNRRVKKTTNDETSYSLYSQSGTLLYRETDDQGINYIYLGSRLVAKDGFIPENAGDQHFKPFGSSVEGEINDAGFTGHKFDTDLGLSYMQARYYDPVIGRFYSNDPLGFRDVHSFNRYAYANNNPYKYVDPDGRSSINARGLSQNMSDFNKVRKQNGVSNTQALGDITGASDVINAVKSGDLGGIALSAIGIVAKPIKAITITSKQLGKKLGKHVQDFGGDPSSASDRTKVVDRINDIANNPDKVVKGTFSGQGPNGTRGDVNFRIQGDDVVVTTPKNEFVTILKDGVNQNTSVKKALE